LTTFLPRVKDAYLNPAKELKNHLQPGPEGGIAAASISRKWGEKKKKRISKNDFKGQI